MDFSRLDETPYQVNERLQFGANERSGFIDRYPAPPPHPSFQPMVEHRSYTHQVHFNHVPFIGTRKVVAAQRVAFQIADQTSLLFGFSNGCIPRLFALVEGTLGYDPPFATQRRDKGDFDTFMPDAKRDHCCLTIRSRHLFGSCVTPWSLLVQTGPA
jgi:hypothetical protein